MLTRLLIGILLAGLTTSCAVSLPASRAALARQELARRELARRHMRDFTCYTMTSYEVSWHHEILFDVLDKFASGEIKRLIIELPPRHGKSELTSRRLPAFLLGRNRDERIISASYGADLAQAMGRDVQTIMDTPEYVRIFPGSVLPGENARTIAHGSRLRNADMFQLADRRALGYYVCAGVGGAITGKGATTAIIDDPIKNFEEAHSSAHRDRVWNWYTSTLRTRLEKDARVLITLTRWHADDLVGRLLKLAEEDPAADQWTVIRLPAIAEVDEPHRAAGAPLWPSRFDLAALRALEVTLGPYQWAALYQQNPMPAGGSILKEEWVRYYLRHELPDHFDEQWLSWDLRFGESKSRGSYVCGQAWGRLGACFYLLDQVRERLDYVESKEAVSLQAARYPRALKKLVERKANGDALLADLRKKLPGLIGVEVHGSKEARCHAVAPLHKAGNVLIPHPSEAPWVRALVGEWITFPSSATNDQVDAMTQALSEFNIGELLDAAAVAAAQHDLQEESAWRAS